MGADPQPAPAGEPEDDDSPFLDRDSLSTADALALLATAEIDVRGRMPYSSNSTFLVDLVVDAVAVAQAIYKPHRGERPLWDFPDGLYRREVAAFDLCDHLGWGNVPPTIERDGPLDVGSLQLFMPSEFEHHYFTLQDEPEHRLAFQQICAFDIVANNTDRKSGHCLLGTDGRIWAIDNGLAFHQEFKLRTVIWEFAATPVPDDLLDDMKRLLDEGVPDVIAAVLSPFEVDAILARTRALVTNREYPTDPTGRRYPWPLV
ncbi:MAG: SCO1664 family protein [Acidimicrobiales bacterium]|nr:SCO1664 family protein [Acidimicrobiales bacterium]